MSLSLGERHDPVPLADPISSCERPVPPARVPPPARVGCPCRVSVDTPRGCSSPTRSFASGHVTHSWRVSGARTTVAAGGRAIPSALGRAGLHTPRRQVSDRRLTWRGRLSAQTEKLFTANYRATGLDEQRAPARANLSRRLAAEAGATGVSAAAEKCSPLIRCHLIFDAA
jgi:hypothetical protein